jgi:hypothetical protein
MVQLDIWQVEIDSPHPLTPSPIFGRRGTRIMSPHLGLPGGEPAKIENAQHKIATVLKFV